MQNIFVAHTPFHVYISEMIVGTLVEFANCKNFLLLEFSQHFEHINNKLWAEVFFLENVGSSILGRNRYLISENNMRLVRNLIGENPKTRLFLSDIAWPMNNRLFFDRQLRRKAVFCLISDGLGTYVLPKVTTILLLRGLVKYLIGLLHIGVRYRNYSGSQFGVDRKEIKYIYAPNVNLVECDDSKRIEVPFSSVVERPLNMSKCLFLDNPYIAGIEIRKSEWNIIRDKAIDFVKSLEINEYYYKSHPYIENIENKDYYEQNGFIIVNTSKCAEQFVDENDFGVIVSFTCSAAFTLKCMFKDRIRCISLMSHTLNMNSYNESKYDEVTDLYNEVKVEMEMLP